jgi:hypothetical protein
MASRLGALHGFFQMIERLLYQLRELAKSRETIICGGICNDFIQYRTVVAELKMLRLIEEEVNRIFVDGEEDDTEVPDV